MTKLTLATILLAAGGESENPLMTLIPLILIIVVFYFFMIRPQVKKQKELKQYRDQVKTGDSIVTVGGIYGKVVDTADNTVTIEVENKMRLKIDKSAITPNASNVMQQQQK